MEVFFFCLAIPLFAIIVTLLYFVADTRVEYLERENRMLWRLLSDQAKLHKMSLDAYIAMLQASSSPARR